MSGVSREDIARYIASRKHLLDPVSHDFATRMYAGGLDKYERRLRQVGFGGCTRVFDAGCGVGQWTLALSRMAKEVTATDIQEGRVFFLDGLVKDLGIANVTVEHGSLEKLRFEDGAFDGVFCFGVIFTTSDWRRALGEMTRVLAPGGLLYANANGIGYYKHAFTQQPNKMEGHDPRKWAALAFYNTWRLENKLDTVEWPLSIIDPDDMVRVLRDLGFTAVVRAGDGEFHDPSYAGPTEPGFFKAEYGGDLGVYEIVARRRV